ncbi:MAG: solute:sodium symporter family transporter [Planctomycetota bacterium]
MVFLTLGSFAFFTALVGVITWFLTRGDDHGSSTGYFLAGRTLTGGYIAGSLMLTNLSTEQLVGLNGAAFADGICVMAWEVIAACSLVIMALFFLPRYLKSGIATVPQFLEERFDAGTRTITTMIFIFAYAVILLPIILYTGATGLSGILNMHELTGIQSPTVVLWGAVWLIGIIGSIYAIFGGLRTVAVSDTINGFGLLVGGVMIVYFGLQAVNGDGMIAALSELKSAHPEKFNSIGGPSQSVPFSTLFTGVVLLNLFYWTTNQQIIQRTFGATSLAEGQKGVLYAGTLKVLAPLILVLPGIIAFHLYSAEGLPKDHAYGHLVQDVLPPPLAGFFAAVMVGAILSSFNSALNSTATLFSLGVYKSMMHPDTDEKQVIRSGKIFGCVIAVTSMTVAPLLAGQDSIFGYLQKMNGLYFIPIFAVMLVGMITKRVPALAAKVGLVVGFAVIALGYFVPAFATYVTALHEFHFLGVVFVSLIALMLIIGQLAPRESAWEHKYSGDVELTPWPLAWPVGIGLVLFVLAIYLWFADFSILNG